MSLVVTRRLLGYFAAGNLNLGNVGVSSLDFKEGNDYAIRFYNIFHIPATSYYLYAD